jgi:hypothetical protein
VGLGYSFKKATALGYVGAVGSHAKVVGELDGKTQLGAGLEVHSIPCAGDRETH